MNHASIRSHMALARKVAEGNTVCHSRKIGCVIADGDNVVSTGTNGPPTGTPPVDSETYRSKILLPVLTDDEKTLFFKNLKDKECPRRLVGVKSGEKNHLCSCVHAETNAISAAGNAVSGCSVFVYGAGCCMNCAGQIINSGAMEVYTVRNHGEYHQTTRFLFENSPVKLFEMDFDYYF